MRRKTIIFLLAISSIFSGSCSLLKKTEEEQAQVKLEESEKSFQIELKKREAAHYKMQTKETKKMMKRSKRASKKINRPRRVL